MRITALTWLLIGLTLITFSAHARTYGSILCEDSANFQCYTVKRGDTFEKLFFNDSQKINLVRRVNRINTEIYPGMRLAIPRNLDTDVNRYSPFTPQINPPGQKVIYVSLKKLAWGAYDESGQLQRWGPVSGGQGYCPDEGRACHTALGKFTIYRKEGAHCFSTRFPVNRGGAPMPYCMFFHGGFALHGSYEVPGYNASHGCVRMFIDDAKWLNEQFTTGSKVAVIISGSS